MSVAEVVQPDHRQPLLPQRLTRLDDWPVNRRENRSGCRWVPSIAEHERRVTHEVECQQPTSSPIGTERGHRARIHIDDA